MSLANDAVRGIANVEIEGVLCEHVARAPRASALQDWQILAAREPAPMTLEQLLDAVVKAREFYRMPGREVT